MFHRTLDDLKMGLISLGIRFDSIPREKFRESKLHHAAINGDIEEVQELILGKRANIHSKDGEWHTPLHWAVSGGNKEVIKLLLEKGADPNHKDMNGWTPLHWAINLQNKEIVALLIDYGATVEQSHLTMAYKKCMTDVLGVLYAKRRKNHRCRSPSA